MDELTLWEIIEGFAVKGDLRFYLIWIPGGWSAGFGDVPDIKTVFNTRKEALIHSITKLKLEA